jgi:pimeloyl-ACP methyl ester carboxylesterase
MKAGKLHVWHQSSDPQIGFIPGGNGYGLQLNKMLVLLSDTNTYATFDRHQMTNSLAKVKKVFNPPKQARDIIVIIKALGFKKAIILGSSLGRILCF